MLCNIRSYALDGLELFFPPTHTILKKERNTTAKTPTTMKATFLNHQ
jgi:hypothetical protein